METLTEERLKKVFKEATTGRDQFRLPDPILARIDKYIAAEPMVPSKVEMIAIQKARQTIRQIEDLFKISVKFEESVVSAIVESSYEKGLGVRSVEKKVIDIIESAVESYLIEHETRRGDQLQISLGGASGASQRDIVIQGRVGHIQYSIPRTVPSDILSDHGFLEHLNTLDQELRSRIFGQDEAIERIKNAVIAHQLDQGKRPLSIFVVGTTGIGKTEVAKALAKSLYSLESRVIVLDMGKVIYEGELNNIFGSPAGHVGSQEERSFERFLIDNPQGGVIVFDEISNMGGKDPSQKDALFKKFYSIFEEGIWTSPATEKTYELSKYTILNSGNDLEGLLQGISSDDVRLSIWDQHKTPSRLRSLLRKSGIPEAFLGRMSDIFLMKPLLQDEVNQITRKLLDEQTKKFKKRGVGVELQASFIEDISSKFFTHDQGARSIRNLIEFQAKSAIYQIIIRAGGIESLQGESIVLSIEDNLVERIYSLPSDPERVVKLTAKLKSKDGQLQSISLDVTEFASKVKRPTRKELLETAYHEASHHVVNEPAITGKRTAMITVLGRDNYAGYTRYEEVRNRPQSMTEERVILEIAILFAGQIGVQMAGFKPSTGWADDLEKARGLATKYILDWGLGKNMASIQVDEKGRPKLHWKKATQFQAEMDRIFKEAENLAESRLVDKWDLVRKIVRELYSLGYIPDHGLSQIEAQYNKNHEQPRWTKGGLSKKLIHIPRCSDVIP